MRPANDNISRPSKRANAVEQWLVPPGRRGRPIGFWHDVPVRRAIIELWGASTIDGAVTQIADQYPGRAPSRSAIQRFWRLMDEVMLAAFGQRPG